MTMSFPDADERPTPDGPPVPDVPDWARERPRPPAGESPSVATTFEVPLQSMNVSGEHVPQRVAVDVVSGQGADEWVRVRAPLAVYIRVDGDWRRDPIPRERGWQQSLDVESPPDWVRAAVRFVEGG